MPSKHVRRLQKSVSDMTLTACSTAAMSTVHDPAPWRHIVFYMHTLVSYGLICTCKQVSRQDDTYGDSNSGWGRTC